MAKRRTESLPIIESGGGAPLCKIDWKLFEDLCGLQCTQTEIASMLKIDRETLRIRVEDHYKENYPSVYEKHSGPGHCSLRRNQFLQSRTNATMAIWLGKNWLGQSDTPKGDISVVELAEKMQQMMDEIQKLQDERNDERNSSNTDSKS